jgi:hypothetical protein
MKGPAGTPINELSVILDYFLAAVHVGELATPTRPYRSDSCLYPTFMDESSKNDVFFPGLFLLDRLRSQAGDKQSDVTVRLQAQPRTTARVASPAQFRVGSRTNYVERFESCFFILARCTPGSAVALRSLLWLLPRRHTVLARPLVVTILWPNPTRRLDSKLTCLTRTARGCHHVGHIA